MLPKPQTFAPSFLKYAVLKQQNCQQNAMTPGAGGIPGSSFYSSGFQHRPGTRLTWQDFLRCPPPPPPMCQENTWLRRAVARLSHWKPRFNPRPIFWGFIVYLWSQYFMYFQCSHVRFVPRLSQSSWLYDPKFIYWGYRLWNSHYITYDVLLLFLQNVQQNQYYVSLVLLKQFVHSSLNGAYKFYGMIFRGSLFFFTV